MVRRIHEVQEVFRGLDWTPQDPVPTPVHTSTSDPLEINWIPQLPGMGRLGMTSAPGKRNENGIHGAHRRSMKLDLQALVAANTHVLVTLMESKELSANGMNSLQKQLIQRGMQWEYFPIRDLSIPPSLNLTWQVIDKVRVHLSAKRNVVVHCRGGHGRTGMFVACLLVEYDFLPKEAIKTVRATRKGTIHNAAQEDFVTLYWDARR